MRAIGNYSLLFCDAWVVWAAWVWCVLSRDYSGFVLLFRDISDLVGCSQIFISTGKSAWDNVVERCELKLLLSRYFQIDFDLLYNGHRVFG